MLTGGAAAILYGTSRRTFDIDFELRVEKGGDWSDVQRAIDATSRAMGIAPQYSDDINGWSLIRMPTKASTLYRRFGKVEVRILKPTLWAIGKLTRYLASDVEDLRVVLKTKNTKAKAVVGTWGEALGMSPP